LRLAAILLHQQEDGPWIIRLATYAFSDVKRRYSQRKELMQQLGYAKCSICTYLRGHSRWLLTARLWNLFLVIDQNQVCGLSVGHCGRKPTSLKYHINLGNLT
jgi:hypothetical protein